MPKTPDRLLLAQCLVVCPIGPEEHRIVYPTLVHRLLKDVPDMRELTILLADSMTVERGFQTEQV